MSVLNEQMEPVLYWDELYESGSIFFNMMAVFSIGPGNPADIFTSNESVSCTVPHVPIDTYTIEQLILMLVGPIFKVVDIAVSKSIRLVKQDIDQSFIVTMPTGIYQKQPVQSCTITLYKKMS